MWMIFTMVVPFLEASTYIYDHICKSILKLKQSSSQRLCPSKRQALRKVHLVQEIFSSFPFFMFFLLQVVFLAVRHYSHLLLKEGAMKRKAGELNILSRSLSGLVVTKLFLVHDDSLKKKGYCLLSQHGARGLM